MTPQIQTPVPHEQHGIPKTTPLAALKARVTELLRAGTTPDEITEATDASQYLVMKLKANLEKQLGGGRGLFPSPATNRTTCTRKPGCECVWHRAEAEREKRLALKRAALKTTQEPSEARNALDAKQEPLEAMPVSARELP